jgi:succinate dehydrogenase / fumarate reductase flavoprotein subunit
MQGLADGYFVIPYTIADYLAQTTTGMLKEDAPECRASVEEAAGRVGRLLSIQGNRTVAEFHREVGSLMWNNAGMARSEESLTEALEKIPAIRSEFWENVMIPGSGAQINQQLENAGRVADFLEFAELFCMDARHRKESCGGHFRVEYQTADASKGVVRRPLPRRVPDGRWRGHA